VSVVPFLKEQCSITDMKQLPERFYHRNVILNGENCKRKLMEWLLKIVAEQF
jgi:hypothetical protein